jgi:hypothetical protein
MKFVYSKPSAARDYSTGKVVVDPHLFAKLVAGQGDLLPPALARAVPESCAKSILDYNISVTLEL